MDKSVYCTVRWSNHSNNVNRFLSVNYAEEKYTDVALACDGHILKAHKMILAGCSPYFEDLFSMYNVSNLCIAVERIAYPILQLVLEFMYSGEIRVKHSELESLVKAGVQLKVKGLDAIKLNDLTRGGGDRSTLVARPNDNNASPKFAKLHRSMPSSVPKSPQKPADLASPPRMLEPLQVQQEKLKPIQKPVTLFGKKPGSASTPLSKPKAAESTQSLLEGSKSSGSPLKLKLPSDSQKSDKKEQSPSTSPLKPGTLSSESNRKVGEWLDSLEQPGKAQESEEAESQPRKTRKRTTKLRAARAVKEPKVPRSVKRIRGSNGVEGDGDPQEQISSPEQGKDPDPIDEAPAKVISPLKETPVKNIPEPERPSAEREDDSAVPTELREEITSPIDSGELNKDDEEPALITKKKDEITTTRSRTIKKPARMVDAEFEFDTEVVNTKKRRSRKADEAEADGADLETAQAPEAHSPPKKRRGAFLAFSADYRGKLQQDFPAENRKEINTRLGILWQNLDQATKDRYQDPDFKLKKDN